jgi:23S rRNA (cytosine1962-C5)-methyltransferase
MDRAARLPRNSASENAPEHDEEDHASTPSQIPPPAEKDRRTPWAQLKYFNYSPTIYQGMVKATSGKVKPGDLVSIYDKKGYPFGAGIFNHRAKVPLRVVYHGGGEFTEDDFLRLIDAAIDLRLDVLRLPEKTNAFRVIHSDADSLSGLVVDKFHDVLSIEVHSLGMHQRLTRWLPHLHQRLGTKYELVTVEDWVAEIEGIRPRRPDSPPPKTVKITEHGLRYEVNFELGHKTGFFCDQRENRRRLVDYLKPEMKVLDLCCYSGGFSLAAAVLGNATEVTGVDLDEKAIVQAKRNANLNQCKAVKWVHVDAFTYARQQQQNGAEYDVVILDPPKLVFSKEGFREGQNKYQDLNRLGISLVKPGGLLVTCSCSGQVSEEQFEQFVIRGAHQQGRRLQILERTGPGGDHPVISNCFETRYLKVIWARVLA